MLGRFENGRRVRILPLKDDVLQKRYPDVNPNAGKEAMIRWGGPAKIGLVPSPPIEPATEDIEYEIELDDGTAIIAPREALGLLE
jgi:hypothetical protein